MLNKLERKYGKYAIPNLSLLIIGAYVLGYVLEMTATNAITLLYLDPYLIMKGQVWRLISWILVPPFSLNLFTLINLFFFYTIGKTLERMWGDFRYNIYIFTGIISVIIGVFVVYFFGYFTGLFGASLWGIENYSKMLSMYVTTYYINISVLLAFAMTIPDVQILFMFVIPLKMKWLAYIEGVFLLLDFIKYPAVGRCVMVVSLLNYIIFYFSSRSSMRISPAQARARRQFRSATRQAQRSGYSVYRGSEGNGSSFSSSSVITRHKCVICGRTEVSNPDLQFRFCSKCNGNYEYCEDHLYTHTHIE